MYTKHLLLTLSVLALAACATHPERGDDHGHSHGSEVMPDADGHSGSKVQDPRIVDATHVAPAYIQLANNVEIIEDVAEAMQNASSTFTHEGFFGPLLFGEELRAYTLRLEPGMFLSEHPHPTESIVYTMAGRWVLSSEGKRKVMQAGSIFHFGSNMPTGWEAAFPEGAEILIFKKKREGENYRSFTDGMHALAEDLDKQYNEGETFYYHQLDADHPAIAFAKQHNPEFDQLVEASRTVSVE